MATALVELSVARTMVGGVDISDEKLQLQVDIVSSFARLEAGEAGAAWDKDTPGSEPPEVVTGIVLDALDRKIEGGNKTFERLGDYSQGFLQTARGGLFTEYELGILRSYRTAPSGLNSIRMTRPGVEEAAEVAVWLPVTGGGDSLMPWSDS